MDWKSKVYMGRLKACFEKLMEKNGRKHCTIRGPDNYWTVANLFIETKVAVDNPDSNWKSGFNL